FAPLTQIRESGLPIDTVDSDANAKFNRSHPGVAGRDDTSEFSDEFGDVLARYCDCVLFAE
ncbi:MAG: hypothetical protein V4719_30430, partial [Planctomycetota bacterium]